MDNAGGDDSLHSFDWLPSETLDVLFSSEGESGEALNVKGERARQYKNLISRLMQQLEGFAGPEAEKFHEVLSAHPSVWRWTMDWWYCSEAIAAIPKAVERFARLAPLLFRRTPSTEVNTYLREATRCYLWGFLQASVALSRAALEVGLNEHLKRKVLAVPQMDLVDKINQAARLNLMSAASGVAANEVRDLANRVVHQQPASDRSAFDVLAKARGVLLELYSR